MSSRSSVPILKFVGLFDYLIEGLSQKPCETHFAQLLPKAHPVRLESAGRDVPCEHGVRNNAFPVGWNRTRFHPTGTRSSRVPRKPRKIISGVCDALAR